MTFVQPWLLFLCIQLSVEKAVKNPTSKNFSAGWDLASAS